MRSHALCPPYILVLALLTLPGGSVLAEPQAAADAPGPRSVPGVPESPTPEGPAPAGSTVQRDALTQRLATTLTTSLDSGRVTGSVRATIDPVGLQVGPSNGDNTWEVRFETRSVEIDGELLEVAPGVVAHRGAGEVGIERSIVSDRYERFGAAVKQSWVIEAPGEATSAESVRLTVDVHGLSVRIIDPHGSALLVDDTESVSLPYRGFEAWDATGATLVPTLVATESGLAITVTGAAMRFPITIDPLIVEPPPWSTVGDETNGGLGTAVVGGADATGDGVGDFLVSVPGAGNDLGRVQLYMGHPGGMPSVIADWSAEGMEPGDRLGASIAMGDVTGDGVADLVIGAPGAKFGGVPVGRVSVFFGPFVPQAAPSTAQSAQWTGYGTQGGGEYGAALALADFDGDGILDIAVGAPEHSVAGTGGGGVFTYKGGTTITNFSGVLSGNSSGARFGESLARGLPAPGAIGDTLIIGAPGHTGSLVESGATYLAGRATNFWRTLWWTEGFASGSGFGTSVGALSDLDGDGGFEITVGSPLSDTAAGSEAGCVFLYSPTLTGGTATGADMAPPRWQVHGSLAGERCGTAISAAGTVDGDATDDLIIGAPGFESGSLTLGRIGVVTGRRLAESLLAGGSGTLTLGGDAVWIFQGSGGGFGTAIWSTSDITGDGNRDLLFGAPTADGVNLSSGGAELRHSFDDCNENGHDDFVEMQSDDCNQNSLLDDCEDDDCDDDGYPDDCEDDCDDDGYPDDCEDDCDDDGYPDDCELDCNGNGYSDDCEDGYEACIENLQCQITDDCICEATLSWVNATYFDQIEIRVEGVVVATLPGDTTNAVISLPGTGSQEICVRPKKNGHYGNEACCYLDCDPQDDQPPNNVVCTPDPSDCSVAVTWENRGDYTQIEVRVNDVLIETLPGTATSTNLGGPFPGMNTLCLRVTSACTGEISESYCNFDCVPLTPRVENLNCQITDPCSCEVTLTWQNGANDYDKIDILVNGTQVIGGLPGNTQTAMVNIVPGAERQICVRATRDMQASADTCCGITCNAPTSNALNVTSCAPSVGVGGDCSATVSWSNPNNVSLTSVTIAVQGGGSSTTVAGNQTTATLPGLLPGMNTICVTAVTECGAITPPACCTVNCPNIPNQPSGVTCQLLDPCAPTCDATVTWMNTDNYDSIIVTIGGVAQPPLAGNATSFSFIAPMVPTPVCVIGVINGVQSTPGCCSIECMSVPNTPPDSLNCTTVNCMTTLTWTNTSQYQLIRVIVNGAVFRTINNRMTETETFSFTLPNPGPNEVCLEAVTVCGDVTAQVCCPPASTFCNRVPLAPTLTCTCNCMAILSWTNNELYDNIEVLAGGVVIATLPGTDQDFTTSMGLGNMATYAVRGVINGVKGTQASCTINCPAPLNPPPPPSGVSCVVDPTTCLFTITWTNPVAYDVIRIFLNGVQFRTLLNNETSNSFTLPLPGLNTVSIDATATCGMDTAMVTCTPTPNCLVPLTPVTNLTCVFPDPCPDPGMPLGCDAILNWVNGREYDAIDIVVDGIVVETLLPVGGLIPTTTTVMLADNNPKNVCVRPRLNNVTAMDVCCEIQCPSGNALPPGAVRCAVSANCMAELTWINQGAYTQVEIIVNEVVTTVLPGTVPGQPQSILVPLPRLGSNTIGVQATTICGTQTLRVDCNTGTFCDLEPISPTNMLCTIMDECTCELLVTWVNMGDPYDNIHVFVNGVFVETIDGLLEMYTIPSAPGSTLVSIVPVKDDIQGPEAFCTVDCLDIDPLPPVQDFMCVRDADCNLVVSWTSPFIYDSLTLIAGTTVKMLDPMATSDTVQLPELGPNTVQLVASKCGAQVTSTCLSADSFCPRLPGTPTNVICTLDDPCTCAATVTWLNVDLDGNVAANPYDEIRILIDGVIQAPAPAPNATSYTFTAPVGMSQVCVVGVVNGGMGVPILSTPGCCPIECSQSQPLPPRSLVCVTDPGTCVATLTWTNPVPYSALSVTVGNGAPMILPVDATTVTVPLLPGQNEVCLSATPVCTPGMPLEVCCTAGSVFCGATPPPVENIACTLTDPCNCETTVTWTNAAPYDAIEVYIDGVIQVGAGFPLVGNATSFTANQMPNESAQVCIEPIINGVPGLQRCCLAECPDLDPAPPVANVRCTTDANCNTTITWLNTGPYSEVRVYVNDMLAQTLPGTAMTALVALPQVGQNLIEIEATTNCVPPSITPRVACLLSSTICSDPPLAPTGISCVLPDPCICEVDLTWTNQGSGVGNSYSEIRVLIDGQFVQSLAGDVEMLTGLAIPTGTSEICLEPVVNGLSGATGCCMATCNPVQILSPTGFVCSTDANCVATLTWANPVPYTTIRVRLNGDLIDVIAGDATTTQITLLPGQNEVRLRGETICGDLTEFTQCDPAGSFCTALPEPVTDLTCGLLDSCSDMGRVTWTNSPFHDEVLVFVDGVQQVTAGPLTQMFEFTAPLGTSQVCIQPITNGILGAMQCCDVVRPSLVPVGPAAVRCMTDGNCNTTVTWQNPIPYTEILVQVNGMTVHTLPGDAVTAPPFLLPLPGQNEVCLVATTACDMPGVQVMSCCLVSETVCNSAPAAPQNVLCTMIDACTCMSTITWDNVGDYDAVNVYIDNVLVDTLPAVAGVVPEMVDLTVPAGESEVCIEPVRNSVTGPRGCCDSICNQLSELPPADLVCTVEPGCVLSISWTNPVAYTGLEIDVNGTVTVLAPGATSFSANGLPGQNVVTVTGTTGCVGQAPASAMCMPFCTEKPGPVTDVACAVDTCALMPGNCQTTVTWNNAEMYDELRVYVDGILNVIMPNPTDTSVTIPTPVGTNEICIEPVINGIEGVQACCTAMCALTTPLAPINIRCTTDANCNSTITWLNPVEYSEIRVKVDGVVVQIIPDPMATTTTVQLAPGQNIVCLEATTICGDVTPEVCCLAADTFCCPMPPVAPPPPETIVCTALGPPGNCMVMITWANQVVYETITISVGGVEVQTVAGTATMATVFLPAPNPPGIPNDLPAICLDGVDVCGAAFVQQCCTNYANDCDVDGIPDLCEPDCDNNGTPDDCEVAPDCNGNNIPDACDIASGFSDDVNPMDGIPDECQANPLQMFQRGDVNANGQYEITDAISMLSYMFASGETPDCMEAADANADGLLTITDAITLLTYLFAGGSLPAPSPTCDTAPMLMGCDSSACPQP